MPEEWAASGARLLLPIDVAFDAAPATEEREPLLGERQGTCKLRVAEMGRFVGPDGEVVVPVQDGAWKATETGRGGESLLRFWLDFPQEARRNDVVLPSGRVFFTNGFWEADGLERCEQAVAKLQQEIDALDAQFEASKDGGRGLIDRAATMRENTLRYDERELLLAKLRIEAKSLPGPTGVVDGPANLRMSKTGGLCVKRRGPWFRGFGEEYHILGSFSMTLLEEEEEES